MRRLLVLLVSVLAVGLAAAGCGGDDGEDSGATPPPPPAATETTGGGTGEGDAANGEQVFASAGCGGCHTFSKAGSNGGVGPNLDDRAPSFDDVVEQVTNGGGSMPAFKDDLSAQEIRDVAAFVAGS